MKLFLVTWICDDTEVKLMVGKSKEEIIIRAENTDIMYYSCFVKEVAMVDGHKIVLQ